MTQVQSQATQVPAQRVRRAGLTLGRDVIFEYLRNAGVEYLFGVPGTNEIPIIDGTDVPEYGIGYIPCLHENIALGAAMGYARTTRRPGVAQLHVTPGIGHAIGNLFNAAKSGIPVVVLCGQQHSNLLIQEPLLASDLVRLAEQYTKWAYEVRGPNELAMAMQRALKTAMAPPMGPVFLSIPWEFLIRPVHPNCAGDGEYTRVGERFVGAEEETGRLVEILAAAQSPVIVAGDGVGAAGARDQLARLASAIGAPVYTEPLSSYMNYPNTLPEWQGELPGVQRDMQAKLGVHDVALFCGFNAQAQLVVFDWEDGPPVPRHLKVLYLHNDPWQLGKNHVGTVAVLGDIAATLVWVCEQVVRHGAFDEGMARQRAGELRSLGGRRERRFGGYLDGLAAGSRPIYGSDIARALRALQDDRQLGRLVLVNEAVSDSAAMQAYVKFESPTSYLAAEGGSLGYSMPAALGVRLAAGQDATVVNVIGDGSALFYPHAWWTAAKFELPILYVITNNHRYQTLIRGLDLIRTSYGWQPKGDASYLRIDPPPEIDFRRLAAAFGVDRSARVASPALLGDALREALRVVRDERRPYLLDVETEPEPPQLPRLDVFFAERGGEDDGRGWLGPA